MSRLPSQTDVLAVFPMRFVERGAARGMDRAALIRMLDEPRERLVCPGQFVGLTRALDLYAHVMRTLGDAGLPIRIARAVHLEELHVIGFAVMTATDGRQAMLRAIRCLPYLTNRSRWHAAESPDGVKIRIAGKDAPSLGLRVANEMALAALVHSLQCSSGDHLVPTRVAFRHARPPDVSAHVDLFGCPVEFGARYDEVVLPNDVFDRVPRHANPALSAYFGDVLAQYLRQHETGWKLEDRVRDQIARDLPCTHPTLSLVARQLAMSERTLRRHLSAEGTTFNQVLADVRFERARALLSLKHMTLGEVADHLGFSQVNAFSRAFKKWSGISPSAFRAMPGRGR